MPTTSRIIKIELEGFDPEAFTVLSFEGSESLSAQFSYTIVLGFLEPVANFDDLLEAKAHLTFGDPPVTVHGMLCSVQQGYDTAWKAGSGQYTRIEVVLVPDTWKLSLFKQTRFFRDLAVPDIIDQVLASFGLTYKVKCNGAHPVRESVLQYQESDLDFIQRLSEREGIHYHYVHTDSETTVVFADENAAFDKIVEGEELPLRPPKHVEGKGNLGAWGHEPTVQRFQSRQVFVPKKVIVKDYNNQTPSTDLTVSDESDGKAAEGIQYTFGDNFKDTDEGKVMNDLRKQEIVTRKRLFFGNSNVHRLYAGGVFKLVETESLDSALGQEYVVTEIHVEGAQPVEKIMEEEGFRYKNTFTCIPLSIVFRPDRRTPWPAMSGLFYATVIAAGEYADVDDQGRYRVQFLFDLENAGSIPVRMLEHYVGANYGIHAPLHGGVEVLVAFEHGDPDRPIIVAAAHNPDFPNTVKDSNHAQTVFRSAGNNELRYDDTSGSEHIFLHGTKDWNIVIDNDKTQSVGRDETHTVTRDLTVDAKRDAKSSVGRNQTHEVTSDRTTKVKGKDSLTIVGAATVKCEAGMGTDVSGGDCTTKVTGNCSTTVSAQWTNKAAGGGVTVDGELKLVAGSKILLTCGGSSITIDPASITLAAPTIKIEGSGNIEIKAPSVKNDGSATNDVSGGVVNVQGSGPVNIKGAVVQVN